MEKLNKLIYYFCIFILSLIALIFSLENGIFFTILSFIIMYVFVSKIKIKRYILFLSLFSFITKLITIIIVKTPMTADFVLMYDTAYHILKEGIHTNIHSYFNTWGYQLFHVFYEVIALSIFNSITFLKILNIIYSTISTIFMYLIVRKLTSEKAARITSLLYSTLLYPLYLNTVLGNQQLALMLALIAIYILLYKKNNYKNILLVGIFLALSHLERNEGIVYLITSVFYLFLTNDNLKKCIKNIFVLIITFSFIVQMSSFIVIKLNINDIGLKNDIPQWKFLLGFNTNTNGKYDGNDEVYLSNKTLLKHEVLNRVTSYKKLPKLFYNKIKIQFLYDDIDNSTNTSMNNLSFKNTIFNHVKYTNYFIILLAFIGVFKEKRKESYFFIINFLIFFLCYMLIEICTRYYYNPEFTIFILSSLGINYIINEFDKKFCILK